MRDKRGGRKGVGSLQESVFRIEGLHAYTVVVKLHYSGVAGQEAELGINVPNNSKVEMAERSQYVASEQQE